LFLLVGTAVTAQGSDCPDLEAGKQIFPTKSDFLAESQFFWSGKNIYWRIGVGTLISDAMK
jgi:hypothetical protein